jgi:hypothetical protein
MGFGEARLLQKMTAVDSWALIQRRIVMNENAGRAESYY